jgi:hypothetical protein
MYSKKLELLAKEYNEAMNRAEEIKEEYIKTCFVQALIDVFEELDEFEQFIFIQSLLNGSFFKGVESTLERIVNAESDSNRSESDSNRSESDSNRSDEDENFLGYIRLLVAMCK